MLEARGEMTLLKIHDIKIGQCIIHFKLKDNHCQPHLCKFWSSLLSMLLAYLMNKFMVVPSLRTKKERFWPETEVTTVEYFCHTSFWCSRCRTLTQTRNHCWWLKITFFLRKQDCGVALPEEGFSLSKCLFQKVKKTKMIWRFQLKTTIKNSWKH